MGIPRLRHHLLPFSQVVAVRKERAADENGLPCIHSVVIDGPSLVYNVYSRLLSWFSASNPCTIDALPTCEEVSRGVMIYLLHLTIVGVEIQAIYFDGALPARKHETRIARLESQRRKLELFCTSTKQGFQKRQSLSSHRTIGPETVLCTRPLPARYSNVPVNPFIVATVFEDLKCRWNNQVIASTAIGNSLPLPSLGPEALPWAGITTMVKGEADTYCAYTAALTGSSVLTNDSDLILHDLGESGSVIFLDSVELSGWDSMEPLQAELRAGALYPSVVARRLGIFSLLPLAYELKTRPQCGLTELLQITQYDTEGADYQDFAEEYTNGHCYVQRQDDTPPLNVLDTRISELYWQFVMWSEYMNWKNPRVYLPVLKEDHTKRCAWVKGRSYRSVGYSILNLSRPLNERHCYTTEFVRRGQRIAEDRIVLRDRNYVLTEMESLHSRVESLLANFSRVDSFPGFWRVFALLESYGSDVEFSRRDIRKLDQFLRVGYMGKQLDWADIHLTAQMQAILYSLRILKQLLQLSKANDDLSLKLGAALGQLPSLYLSVDTPRQGQCADGGLGLNLSKVLLAAGKGQDSPPTRASRPSSIVTPFTQEENAGSHPIPPQGTSLNMYEILDEQ
ncbi:XPG domain containing-domain-containing protein [Aspergillus pseudoustus]|uniref:XPG domain containing-domain-containing protein n=1 Tax=Aspergillus pseudoustus TaxID=1810923 RepID=A0ABR4JBQ2_9EURO